MAEPLWRLDSFLERFDAWCHTEQVTVDERVLVTLWVMTRMENPFVGVRREPGFADLWFGPIPSTAGNDRVIVCSYWVDPKARTVRCNSFARLSLPL